MRSGAANVQETLEDDYIEDAKQFRLHLSLRQTDRWNHYSMLCEQEMTCSTT